MKSGFSLDFFVEIVISIYTDGGSYRGNTAGSGPANRGSNPRPPAINSMGSREKTVSSGELGIRTVLTPYCYLGEKAKPGPLDLAFFVMGAAWTDNFMTYPHLV